MSDGGVVYPSKRLQRPGDRFTIRQFILPIRINGTPLWGWLDTGANITILPKEVAVGDLGLRVTDRADGGYNLADLIRVPYQSITFDLEFLRPIENTIQTLDKDAYSTRGETAIRLTDVEFQVPILTWSEIAQKVQPSEPVMIVDSPLPWVILGSDEVLEQLHLSMTGNNALSVSLVGHP